MRQRQLIAAALLGLAVPVFAQQAAQPQQPANEQVVQPEIERRELRLPKFPSKDFEIGIYGGAYATESFGASAVGGLRLGYHLTEDFFVQGVYAGMKVSDERLQKLLGGSSLFPGGKTRVTYYNLSAGYNVLPGEVFIGRNRAFASQVYLMAGVGSTRFSDTSLGSDLKRQTFNFGLGLRVLLHDRFSVQVDMRDHMYRLDLLGRDERTNNLELTTGISYYF